MTEFNVEVVKLDNMEPHPNADTLSVTHIFGGYPVIFKTTSFQLGDKVVYIPVDAMLPLDNPLFAFLKQSENDKVHRVKAKKLRGVLSMGMIVPADPEWQVGENVQDKLKIYKCEPNIEMGSEGIPDPELIPRYTDMEGLRKYAHVLKDGESVYVTEKIHGCTMRAVYCHDNFWVANSRTFKARDSKNMWWHVAEKYGLERKLATRPGLALYGEIYGQVQDLKYGAGSTQFFFAAFDIVVAKTLRYLDYDGFIETCKILDIPVVPLLYHGPWRESLCELAEGNSMLAPHVREGIVVRPEHERWDHRVGRVILKHIGTGYLLRRGA